MTDRKMYQLLERFANEHTLGKDIKTVFSPNSHSFTPRKDFKGDAMKYEDVVLLAEFVRGAEHFLLWARRKKVKL